MNNYGKKYQQKVSQFDLSKKFSLDEGVSIVKKVSYSKFDGTVEIHVKTSCNPKYQDQIIRGTTSLPHGTGKDITVAAFVSDDKIEKVLQKGATTAGNDQILEKIKNGSIDFDVIVTTPDMMRELASVAKILGPKGLMPSPRSGTVGADIEQLVVNVKGGMIEYKLDKTGNIHLPVGKVSFEDGQLIDNITTVIDAIREDRPSGAKGALLRKVVLSPTMGPSVQIDV